MDGVDEDVDEHLLDLMRVGHDRGQIRLQLAHQLDVLVGQFVPDEQAQVVDQLVEVHRRHAGLGAAGEVEDLFDDLVQVIHLLAHDAGILGARVGRWKFQVERMIEHLHHRERIADLVGDLGGQESEGR